MQPDRYRKLMLRHASRLLAWVPAVMVVAVALIFAMFLPGEIGDGNTDSLRWFAFSAFPLMVVVCIAVFTHLQRKFDQKFDKRNTPDNNRGWQQS